MHDKLNKNEMKVLQILQEFNNESNAIKIKTLAELSNLSYFSVRNIIKGFYLSGICEKGRRDGNAETYYLSKKNNPI